ncbi:TetR/AcrR family transcriptional regulator [Parasediminibacterium sp. JCM 36343]|uniref:TetR/AcrR family transcriptional regulator n=1 Tax=Parasediminibacterium sp. JCM 36343 TaxID=3374279 RepID=UPI00397867F0
MLQIYKEMETDERIVKKAHELYMRFGIRSVSMDEIAGHLGISKKTIYQFYKDKDALVEGVLDIEMRRMEIDCTCSRIEGNNAVHEIFLAMDIVEEMFKGFNPAILYDLEKYHPKAYTKFTDHHNTYLYDCNKANIERGIMEGLYRPEINIDIMCKYRIGTMLMIFNANFFPHGKYPLATLCSEITDNFLHGLATPKGKEWITKYKMERSKVLLTT